MRVMYIENKESGEARIGLVKFSRSYKTLYYGENVLHRVIGYKYNHRNVNTDECFWISAPKKNGFDALYGRKKVLIDENAREEYWLHVRELPKKVHLTEYLAEGKY